MREDWEVKKLGDVCNYLTDGDWIENKDQSLSGIRLIQTGNIGKGYFKDKSDSYKFISESTFYDLDCKEVFPGDILVSRLPDPIGRACIVPQLNGKLITAVDCTIIRTKELLLSQFFIYYTMSNVYYSRIKNFITGAVRKRISRSNLSRIEIPIPPLQTQHQIVEELDCLTSIIDKQKKQLEELDNLAQAIFYDMFGDPIENEKGWETQLIGNVCKFSQGVQVDLPLQSFEPKKSWNRFLRISDYTIGDIEKRYVDIQDLKYYVYPNDVVIVRYGASAGFVGIDKEGILANNLFKLNHDKSILDYKFLYYYLSTDYYKNFIQKVAFGAAMPALSFNSFKSFKVFIPPLPLQQQFASKIEAIEKQKELIKKSIKETEDLFNSRMDYYFN